MKGSAHDQPSIVTDISLILFYIYDRYVQWWIQDFPGGGGGADLLFTQFFSKTE